MVNTATLTGYTGPGALVTALVLNDVFSVDYDFDAEIVTIVYGSPRKSFKLSYNDTTTITMTKSAGNTTITITNV